MIKRPVSSMFGVYGMCTKRRKRERKYFELTEGTAGLQSILSVDVQVVQTRHLSSESVDHSGMRRGRGCREWDS
jgi:hypothetical protein